jgi:hypothetical protein
MKSIYLTKDLNSLFIFHKTSNIPRHGFDLLNNSACTKVNQKELIEVKPESKLLVSLLKDDIFKVELVESLFETDLEKSDYLGVTDRTYYRKKALTK